MNYRYTPLHLLQIRLLTIAPSEQFDADIHCTLQTTSTAGNQIEHYEALSYTWGEPNQKVTVYLDDFPFLVTINLNTALHYLRQPQTPRVIWVDAICINQADVDERNDQVQKMGYIYSHASQVLIWLGGPDSEVEETMAILPDLRARFDPPEAVTRGLSKILKKSWWHRVWVIQEVVLATQDPTIGCGNTWLKWDIVARALVGFAGNIMNDDRGWIREDDSAWDEDPTLVNRFVLLRSQWRGLSTLRKKRPTIAEMIERTRGHEASDEKDQVYAILGLVCDEESAITPVPKYEKSVSEVYQETMFAIFKSNEDLEFLIHAPDKHGLTLPSWCADFSKKNWDWGNYSASAVDDSNGTENQQFVKNLVHDPSSGTLKIIGSILGNVLISRTFKTPRVTVEENLPQDQKPQIVPSQAELLELLLYTFLHQVTRFTTCAYMAFKTRYGEEKASERITAGQVWETLCKCLPIRFLSRQACSRVGIKIEEEEDMLREYSALEQYVAISFPQYRKALEETIHIHFQSPPSIPERAGFRQALIQTIILMAQESFGTSWFVTDSGFIGRAEREVEANDLLCMISGCHLPFILRPGDQDTFQLISTVQSTDRFENDFKQQVKESEKREFCLR